MTIDFGYIIGTIRNRTKHLSDDQPVQAYVSTLGLVRSLMELKNALFASGHPESIWKSGPLSRAGIEKRTFAREHEDQELVRQAREHVHDTAD
jgi:hypothetical protein